MRLLIVLNNLILIFALFEAFVHWTFVLLTYYFEGFASTKFPNTIMLLGVLVNQSFALEYRAF